MKKTVNAVLIDPYSRTVNPIQLDDNTHDVSAFLQQIYGLVGTDEVSSTGMPNGDRAWFDDNGLLRPWNEQAFFSLPGFVGSLAGKWVIMRSKTVWDDEIKDQLDVMEDCRAEPGWLRQRIRWLEPQQAAAPAPSFQVINKDGTMSKPETLDGGPKIWTYNDNPSTRE